MALVSCRDLQIAFGGRPLLAKAGLQIERFERIGLVGRNGEGKSTLLKILAGELPADSGEVVRDSGLQVSLLAQQVPVGLGGSVEDVIAQGQVAHRPEPHAVQRLASVLSLNPDDPFSDLSGGQKRRALLGRALASEPDLLLLDEPTNHLDLDGIEWLETFLMRRSEALLFVTHDRAFLSRLATRIVELDRGNLTSWECDYPTYLTRKEALLRDEERDWAAFDKKLAQEETWIRRGIKARRTRNEGRVRALQALRKERAERRERTGQVRMALDDTTRSGKRVIQAKHVSFSFGDEPIVRDLSVTIMRGDKVGIIGPNGSGKTTLLSLLLGIRRPDAGSVEHGTSIEVAYFDQHRAQLDEARSVLDNLNAADTVRVGGVDRHVYGYLEDFLFSPERARQPVSALSGGERNRLLLARLFARPANVLVLDEPTNDLDAETLELLEALLVDFQGTVLAVSHDRRFLDNLCTSTLVLEGNGVVKEFVGGYSDWQRVAARATGPVAVPQSGEAGTHRPRTQTQRLSFKEKQEWEGLPARIEQLEKELRDLQVRMSDPDFFRGDSDIIRVASERVGAIPAEIDACVERWAALEERA